MPRKRVPKALRETPEARAQRAAILDELRTPLVALNPKAAEKQARKAKKFAERVDARGGDLAAALAELDREGLLHPKPVAANAYAAHRAAVPERLMRTAERPAPAMGEASATGEPSGPQKPRKRRPAGLVGYARITDDDDFDEWD